MALVGVTIDKKNITGTFTGDQQDSVTKTYFVEFDAPEEDPDTVLLEAQGAASNAVPIKRAQYKAGVNMYADQFEVNVDNESRKEWAIDVTWRTPNNGEHAVFALHPILRPPKIRIDYIQREAPVYKGWNKDAFNSGVYDRPVDTLGAFTNSIGKETIDPVRDTFWDGVITVTRWLPNVFAVLALNSIYKNTSNSDVIMSMFPPETLKYQVTKSGEEGEQDNIPFFEIRTSIEITDTARVFLNNVGYETVLTEGEPPNQEHKLVGIKDDEGENIREPRFLDLAGKVSNEPVLLEYAYRNPVSYASLVS